MNDQKGFIKGVGEEIKEAAKDVAQQVTGAAQTPLSQESKDGVVKRDASTEELVKGLYEPQESSKPQSPVNDQARLARLRQKLHKETYYEPLIRRKTQEEERAQKAAQPQEEAQEKHMELIQDKKKTKPLAVQMASEKVERFRGVSG